MAVTLTDHEKTILALAIANEQKMLEFLNKMYGIHAGVEKEVLAVAYDILADHLDADGQVNFQSLSQPLSFFDQYSLMENSNTWGTSPNVSEWMRISGTPKTYLDLFRLYLMAPLIKFGETFREEAQVDWNDMAQFTADKVSKLYRTEPRPMDRDVLEEEWSDGYSKAPMGTRIEDNAIKVAGALFLLAEQRMASGVSPKGVADLIKDRFRIHRNDISRISETTSTMIATMSVLIPAQWAGYDCFKHLSVLDSRTSPLCRSRNLVIFPMSAYEQGVTVPPLHNHCRSVVVPIMCNGGDVPINTEEALEFDLDE